ncbi:GlsB/YeaQ/YmgE family stress response membrane protein [Hyphococcus luteus]|uniref:GlsB/YeaQ/YmgE family stress response membrane protein n=1 Tax=Hyphococcus luteus TaxID=2058213 RepID=A0A2S7K417_9PROT|nr:GlsB/YeaQ/YmgE family stress response membrane protein [Marinicaulis flavus]PQA87226.1 GlsB/YeaQ/YmgE family stress response membrane protein [Marinicaulis flavus]
MSLSGLLIWLLIGAIAGWLAGIIVKGYGFGLIGNIVVGIVGAFVGGWLFGQFGIVSNGVLGAILGATTGAVIVLFLIRLVRSV